MMIQVQVDTRPQRLAAREIGRTLLTLREVGVCYRRRARWSWRPSRTGVWALRDVSLSLHAGETLGIIGRNGAGKSTLLKLLAGIIRPDRGDIWNCGCRANLLSLQVGFVPHLSGRRNIVLSGLLLGLSLPQIRQRMESIVAFAELEEFIDEPIHTYSSGMRARLGFSTAFHVDPDILLIDEVLGVGDAAFVEKSKRVMRDKIRSEKTAVLVSHQIDSICSLCNRVVWLHRGTVLRQGSNVEQIVDEYLRFRL